MYARSSCKTQYVEIEPKQPQPYRTPWCDILGCCSGETTDILHFYYPLALLQEEVHKRTSYLGKHRNSENAPHLLDLISMTKDEDDLFHSFARTAMAKVFDPLGKMTKHIEKAYLWEANATTLTLTKGVVPAVQYYKGIYILYKRVLYLATGNGDSDTLENLAPTPDFRESIHYIIQWDKTLNPNFIEPLDQSIQDALVYFIIWKWLLSAYPSEAEIYQAQYEDAIEDIKRNSSRMFPAIVFRIPHIY